MKFPLLYVETLWQCTLLFKYGVVEVCSHNSHYCKFKIQSSVLSCLSEVYQQPICTEVNVQSLQHCGSCIYKLSRKRSHLFRQPRHFVLIKITTFTCTHDNSNLRWPPKIKHTCHGKIYLSKSKMTTPKQMSAKKKYFTINFIQLIIQKVWESVFSNQCHSLHLHSRCIHLPHTCC